MPVQGRLSISNLFDKASAVDLLSEGILEAIRGNGSLKEITVAECTEQEGQIRYRGNDNVPAFIQLQFHLIQVHYDAALEGHPDRAKTFHLLDGQYYWKDMWK